jgi:hypothetical protein
MPDVNSEAGIHGKPGASFIQSSRDASLAAIS